jgi:prevent-host-death family protein
VSRTAARLEHSRFDPAAGVRDSQPKLPPPIHQFQFDVRGAHRPKRVDEGLPPNPAELAHIANRSSRGWPSTVPRRFNAPGSPLTAACLYDNMSYMAKASVSIRELQQHLKRVMARVERGEVVEVTRRRRPVAHLAPVKPRGPASPWPDLKARRRAVFGDRVIAPGGSELVTEGRGRG